MDYPEVASRTRRFTQGAPRAVTVADDGSRVVFLRSAGPHDPADALWSLDVASASERLVADPAVLLSAEPAAATGVHLSNGTGRGIDSYATDPGAHVAALNLAGRLFRADLVNGDVVEVPVAGPVLDPRPDPTGTRIAYLLGTELRVVDYDGTDMLLAGEDAGVVWGQAEAVAARQFGRNRGYWWAPNGESILAARVDAARLPRWHLLDGVHPERTPTTLGYPRAGGPIAQVSLHVLDLDGAWVDVHWDRETYPYLVSVHWADGVPLITVLRRLQQHGLVLAVDPRTGETQVHAELADPRWVDPIPGTPRHLPDGRVLVGGELAHDGYDARCLFADGTLITSPALYVRRVVGRVAGAAGPPELVVEVSDGEPSQQHLYRIRTALGVGGAEARRVTTEAGWHTGVVGGDVLVVGSESLDHSGL
ncbi:MAG TPA: DPP IV N-terminal domain-containing protein, partial [Micromonospora sp.]|nr:DPP IV N-terminal domain-containing protein [Micromonospora sp.]